MSTSSFSHCVSTLKRILIDIEAARGLKLGEETVALLLPRLTVQDMWYCDIACREIHQWCSGGSIGWRPGDLLAQGPNARDERSRQMQAEVLAIRVRYGLDVTDGEWQDLLDSYHPTADLKTDLETVLIDSWYRNWFQWSFERFGRFHMPLNPDLSTDGE